MNMNGLTAQSAKIARVCGALILFASTCFAQYPANPQYPITRINRGRSTQIGGLIIFDDPVEFNGGIVGSGTGGGLSLTGTSGPIYINEPDFNVAMGQDVFENWNGNAELTVNASLPSGNPNALIAHTQGSEGIPVVAWSESGAPAFLATQDTQFSNPTFAVYRSGTAGNTTSTATMLVQCGLETTGTTPVLQVGGCISLSGDNWDIIWGDGALSLPGGILDNTGLTHGHISIDPVHRQLLAEDGITPVLTWTGTQVQFGAVSVSGSFSAPYGTVASSGTAGYASTSGSAAVAGSAITSSTATYAISSGSAPMGWYNPPITATAAGSVVVGASNPWCVGMIPVTVSGGPFIYNVAISGSNATPGALVRVDVDVQPSASGTVGIYNGSTSSNMMQVVIPLSTSEQWLYFQAGYDGTNWHKECGEWVQ